MTDLSVNLKLTRKAFNLNVDLTIPGQGITALLGPSGSGKTTILRALAGLEKIPYGGIVYGGQVWFDSAKKIHVPPQKRNIGIVFQDYALFSHLNVAQNVAYGLPKNDAKEKVNHWLERLHIKECAQRYPHQLSGGQRQRVALARAMIIEPRLLLLDEPFSALDVNLRQQLREELSAVMREAQCPAVLVTHDLHDARYVADRVGVIVNGRMHCYGPKEEVFADPRSKQAAQILGWQNFLPIKENTGYAVKGSWGEAKLLSEASPDAQWLAIKPEHVRFATSGSSNTLSATVDSIVDLGAVRAIKCRLQDGTQIYIHYPWDKPAPTSQTDVRLYFAPQYLKPLGETPTPSTVTVKERNQCSEDGLKLGLRADN
jgi:ABC-type sulfate/molybdate transport systems ATPase subunit